MIQVHKFASVTSKLSLDDSVEVVTDCLPDAGQVVIVRAKGENPNYPDIELKDRSFSKIQAGDIIAGALGSRQALKGFVGYAPYRLRAGETLQILNMGGVMGRCVGGASDLGNPIDVEVLGCAVKEGKLVNVKDVSFPEVEVPGSSKPVTLVLGSCMHVGKTAAATEIVRLIHENGLKVSAAKVSGVACLRDLRKFDVAGAEQTLSFLDCGVASTIDADVSVIAKTLIANLTDVDRIVMETGDGILGYYQVEKLLDDASFMANVDTVVFCASDLVSVYGGVELLKSKGINITVVCGPVTDSVAGTSYIEKRMGIPAVNAVADPDKLFKVLSGAFAEVS
jgi:hypothetical protein